MFICLAWTHSHMGRFVLDPLNSGELPEKLEELHWHKIQNRDVKFNCHCPSPSVRPSRTSAVIFLFDQGFVFLVKKKVGRESLHLHACAAFLLWVQVVPVISQRWKRECHVKTTVTGWKRDTGDSTQSFPCSTHCTCSSWTPPEQPRTVL